MIKQLKLWVLLLAFMPIATFANESAETLSTVELKNEPYSDATLVTSLPAQTAVMVVKRQGAWVNVQTTTSGTGWLKMTAIKLIDSTSSDAKKSADSGFDSLFNLGRKSRAASNGLSVTTGIRGLSEEELKSAQPNTQAVGQMDGFAASKTLGETFAKQGQLKNQQIDYFKP